MVPLHLVARYEFRQYSICTIFLLFFISLFCPHLVEESNQIIKEWKMFTPAKHEQRIEELLRDCKS